MTSARRATGRARLRKRDACRTPSGGRTRLNPNVTHARGTHYQTAAPDRPIRFHIAYQLDDGCSGAATSPDPRLRHVQRAHLAIEVRALDAERLRGLGDPAAVLAQHR